MRIYYLQAEYAPGKHRIVTTVPEDTPVTITEPFSVIDLDERWNRSLVKGLSGQGITGAGGSMIYALDPYYVDNAGQIRDKNGVLQVVVANPNKADWVASVLAGATDAQIDTWFTNNVTTLLQARTVMAMMAKLVARLARQAGFE